MQLEKVFEGTNVRIAIENEQPLFHLGDVLKAVESKSNPSEIKKNIDEDDLFTKEAIDSLGRKQSATFISELGLIELLTILRVPKTKEFRRWALREVIPTVMKTGKYEVETLTTEQQLAQAVLLSQKVIEEKNAKIAELEPKALTHDKVLDKGSSLGFRQLAATIRDDYPDMNENELKDLMREHGLIQKRSVSSTAKAREEGYALDVVSGTYGNKTRTQTRWTPDGIGYIIYLIENN